MDHEIESASPKMSLIVDTGVNRTLLAEKEWVKLCPQKGLRVPKLKKNKRRFIPFGTNGRLECIRRSKVKITAAAGSSVKTKVYIIKLSLC